ncbi:hypothetical protein NG819_07885 [Pseudarthrobacter sp. Fe7]|nr:hypothetical protein NG819_07885 [Pseudarthrobacter sp. Fe7]
MPPSVLRTSPTTSLVLALEYTPAVRDVCTATQSTATLNSISLTTQGTETAPTTVAEFLAPSVPAILIPVPAEPATDVSAAILAAPAALAHRYPDAALKLVPPQDVDAQSAALPAGSRIITISTDGAPSTALGIQAGRPALTITGTGEGLRTAARALADTKSALADGAVVTGMTATVPAAAGPEQTFTDLGAQAIRLAGYGTQETYLGVNRSQFGDPVSAISLQAPRNPHRHPHRRAGRTLRVLERLPTQLPNPQRGHLRHHRGRPRRPHPVPQLPPPAPHYPPLRWRLLRPGQPASQGTDRGYHRQQAHRSARLLHQAGLRMLPHVLGTGLPITFDADENGRQP